MYLSEGRTGKQYKVESIRLPVQMEKRLEALGMTRGTEVDVLNSKSRGVLIVKSGEAALPSDEILQGTL